MKNSILFSFLLLNFISCDKQKKETIVVENNPLVTETSETIQETEIVFPKTGKKVADFIPNSSFYVIQYEASGDLNNDGLIDKAIVLANKNDKTTERPVLILLQNNDKTFSLDKVSTVAIPAEYLENDFKSYIDESLEIENGILKINLYGSGEPVGNIFSHYKFIDNDFIFVYIETYNIGAGSWQNLYYNLEKAELTEEITNTMTEEMESKSKTYKLKNETYRFEKDAPENVIAIAFNGLDSNW
ncbi:hypothetical protein [Flavobacterium sp. I3-2]|uniref:hypothetical protein n=1 Tax=Flavobacterium sp. I3-2 TaxID=2748319 RepID=UPI0015AB0729|nr:hypothetical protein [Flavobacterium sp. I3-2]